MAFRTKRLMLTHHRVSHQMPEQADGIIALDALLALNDRIGKPNNTKTAKTVVHSEHSAFVKYGTNGHTSQSSNGGGTSTISASDIDNTGRNIMVNFTAFKFYKKIPTIFKEHLRAGTHIYGCITPTTTPSASIRIDSTST